MDPISILFFALASFLGVDEPRIVSRTATVTIDPVQQTFEVVQEDLFAVIITKDDSMTTIKELELLLDLEKNTRKNASNSIVVDSLSFQRQEDQLHAVLKGRYSDVDVWKDAAIYLDSTGLSMINIPEWNIQSVDAVLNGNYWIWPANKKVTFVLEAFENIPTDYLPYQRSLLPYWNDRHTDLTK